MSCESDVCRQDIPYPIVSQESVASILGNLTSALYGTITKTVVDGRVVWSTCDVNQQATVFGIPRNAGEGLMCYFLRAFQDSRVIAVPAATSASQVLVSQQAGSQTLVWKGYASAASPNTIVSRNSQGSSEFYDVTLSGNLYASGTIACENNLLVSQLGIVFANGTTQTVAGITSLTGDVTGSPVSNGSAPTTVVAIRGIGVSTTSPTSGQVLKYNGTQWAPAADVGGITALTGDVVASGTGSVVATLANSGVIARNYGSANYVAAFTVDAKGRITSASEMAITPAAIGAMPVFSTLGIALGGTGATTQQAALNALAGAVTSGQFLRGTGANVVLSAIQASDVPTLNQNTTGTASNVTGVVAVANGGTGATTQQGALNALAGAVTSGQYLRGTGANVVLSAIQAGDVPTLNQNTTGTASNVTGTVAIANGGTGSTTAAGARTALGVDASGTTVLKAGDTMSGALTISTNGTGSSLTISNATTATSDCVVITNQGTGKSLIVNDVAGDITPFIIHAAGEVAIGTTDTPAAVLSIKQTTLPTIRILSGTGANGDLIKYQHNTTNLRDFSITAASELNCYSIFANSTIQSNSQFSIVDGLSIGTTSIDFSSINQTNVGQISRGYYETTSSQATVTINAGTQKTYSITVTNAALQDFALASLNVSAGNTDATALQITAHVHAANTVIVVIRNSTASNVTLTTPTIKVRVWKS